MSNILARVDGARIPIIVHDKRDARGAVAKSIAGLVPVAHVAIGARRSGNRCVNDSQDRITAIDRARVSILERGWHAGRTETQAIAGLVAIADVTVGARCTLRPAGELNRPLVYRSRAWEAAD